MMIVWVDSLLSRWGRWRSKRGSAALGYGSVSPMVRDCATGCGWSAESDPGFTGRDVIDCDVAVNSLPLVLRVVVIHHYQRRGSLRDTAKECGVDRKTATQYIGQAHEKIAAHMDAKKYCDAA